MNEANTKGVENVLKEYSLKYLPEAHTYLKVNGTILDITRNTISGVSFENTILFETEIQPEEIGTFKIKTHKDYLKQWLLNNNSNYSFNEIWNIRELCILALTE
ncbi:MAG: hypothetical protein QNK89_00440 [Lacinutrix sp.]|uniref:hypothetical protein n=1 Tax=Lacinutrix sp. TaxID=1937692 RepID=UPI003094CC8B